MFHRNLVGFECVIRFKYVKFREKVQSQILDSLYLEELNTDQ